MNGDRQVGLPWAASLGFIRLMTHRSVLVTPLAPRVAVAHVTSWFERPHVTPLDPGPCHLEIVGRLLDGVGVGGSLTTDAHLAAIAIEHGFELHSNDADFARFAGLRWKNPMQPSRTGR